MLRLRTVSGPLGNVGLLSFVGVCGYFGNGNTWQLPTETLVRKEYVGSLQKTLSRTSSLALPSYNPEVDGGLNPGGHSE